MSDFDFNFPEIWSWCNRVNIGVTLKDWLLDAYHMKLNLRYYRDKCCLCMDDLGGSHLLFNCKNINSLECLLKYSINWSKPKDVPLGAKLGETSTYVPLGATYLDNIIILYWNWLCFLRIYKNKAENKLLTLCNILNMCNREISKSKWSVWFNTSIFFELCYYNSTLNKVLIANFFNISATSH